LQVSFLLLADILVGQEFHLLGSGGELDNECSMKNEFVTHRKVCFN